MVERIRTANQLQRAFKAYDRNYFTPSGYEALLRYYDSVDENTELDVIEVCGRFTEYDDDELINDYGYIYPAEEFLEDNEIYCQDVIGEMTREECMARVREHYLPEYMETFFRIVCNRTYAETLPNGHYLVMDF